MQPGVSRFRGSTFEKIVDKSISIVKNANETVGDPRYPFDLLCRVITVSLETMKIVRVLLPLGISSAAMFRPFTADTSCMIASSEPEARAVIMLERSPGEFAGAFAIVR